jgi:transposase InsO family protein
MVDVSGCAVSTTSCAAPGCSAPTNGPTGSCALLGCVACIPGPTSARHCPTGSTRPWPICCTATGRRPRRTPPGSAITYIKTWQGWAYLATVIDCYSRRVVGFAIADHMRTGLIIDALRMAITHRNPPPGVIFHSDRGAQYTSDEFRTFCRNNGVRPSVGRTGICYDNAVAESFFATLKKELIHLRPWPTLVHLRTAVFEYVESYYNRRRRHSTIGYDTPIEYEQTYAPTRLQAA